MDEKNYDEVMKKFNKKDQQKVNHVKKKHHGNKTQKAMMREMAENSEHERLREAMESILKIVKHFPEYKGNQDLINRFEERYITWIKTCLQNGKLILRTQDVEQDFFRSSGNGGQNIQKRDTAVRLTHRITNIMVENQEERTQEQNEENAREILKDRLVEHLKHWQVFLNGKNPEELTRYDITDLLEKDRLSNEESL
jgi:hypothetical protein